jgi:uncharacterized damage-inducible protein DinB
MSIAESLLAELEQEAQTTRRVLERVPQAHLSWKRVIKGDRELMAMPRVAFARSIMLNHWYHHRGQLLVYLRLLNLPVPSVYGPTADENPFPA